MKVMHVGQMIGGLQVYIKNTCSLMPQSIEYVLVHGKADQSSPAMQNGNLIKEYKVPLHRSLSPYRDLKCLVQTIHIIKREKPDLIHCHSAKGGIIGRIAGWWTGVNTVYTPHAFSFLCSPNKFKSFLFKSFERVARTNSYLLACSNSERQMGIDVVHYKKDHALVWQNAVPDAALKIKDVEFSLPDNLKDRQFVVCIGRPSYQKNTEYLVEVVRKVHHKLPNLCFVLLGVGFYSPRLEQMENLIKKYDLQDVITLIPWLEQKDTLAFVKQSLFYLSVARYEGLPLSIIEAMSLSKAVVASKVPGNIDCVKNDFNGYLVDLENIDKMSDSIISMAINEDFRKQCECNSRILFEQNFFINNRIQELEYIYTHI